MKKNLIPTAIDGIEFDALISKSKLYEAEIPDYPVETGYNVSDNISIRPLQLTLELYLTPTPVTWRGRHGGEGWVEQVCEQIEEMFFGRKLVTIETSEETYANMGITSLTIADTTEEGYAKVISCTAKKVYTTNVDTVDIPAEIAQSGKTGTQAGVASVSKSSPASGSSGSSGSGGASRSEEKEESRKGHSILYGVADGLSFF